MGARCKEAQSTIAAKRQGPEHLKVNQGDAQHHRHLHDQGAAKQESVGSQFQTKVPRHPTESCSRHPSTFLESGPLLFAEKTLCGCKTLL